MTQYSKGPKGGNIRIFRFLLLVWSLRAHKQKHFDRFVDFVRHLQQVEIVALRIVHKKFSRVSWRQRIVANKKTSSMQYGDNEAL